MPILFRKKLITFLLITAGILGTLMALLGWLTQSTLAQSGQQIFVDKQLGRSSPVVHVGESITFTILIENQTSFTVTTLPLSDTFNVAVLAFVDAVPMPDIVDAANGRLDWNDLTAFFGDLGPGQQITVVTGFIAEHPAPIVVNRAAVHDAQGSQGSVPGGGDDSTEGESIGGSSPVTKKLLQGDTPPQVGLPITFTITITNNGFTTMTVVPVVDDYDPAFLQFQTAVPQPDIVDEVNGDLIWSDLTLLNLVLAAATFRRGPGRLAPETPVVESWVEGGTVVISAVPPPPAIAITRDALPMAEVVEEETAGFPTGHLTIPKLKINAEIITAPIHEQSWDVTQLGHNVGWLAQTGTHPGDDLAMVFAGHMTFPTDATLEQGAFAELQYATYGTEIIYQSEESDYVYTVSQISRVPPEAIEALFLADGNSILLVTCTDWHPASRTYENRLIVRATRVDS